MSSEFDTALRQIPMMGYGLILITHEDVRVEKVGEGDETIEIIKPSLDKRCYAIVNQIVDVIGYISATFVEGSDIISERFLQTRATRQIFAGSRFRHLKARIPFGYEELVKALGEAIEKQAEEGDEVVDDKDIRFVQRELRPLNEALAEAKKIWDVLLENPENLPHIKSVIKKHFGRELKLSEVTEPQQELLELVIEDMKKL